MEQADRQKTLKAVWAIGYYIGSVSDKVTTELVKEYIRNQKSKDENSNKYSNVFRQAFSIK